MNWRRASLLMFGSSLAIELAIMVALGAATGKGIDSTLGAWIDATTFGFGVFFAYLGLRLLDRKRSKRLTGEDVGNAFIVALSGVIFELACHPFVEAIATRIGQDRADMLDSVSASMAVAVIVAWLAFIEEQVAAARAGADSNPHHSPRRALLIGALAAAAFTVAAPLVKVIQLSQQQRTADAAARFAEQVESQHMLVQRISRLAGIDNPQAHAQLREAAFVTEAQWPAFERRVADYWREQIEAGNAVVQMPSLTGVSNSLAVCLERAKAVGAAHGRGLVRARVALATAVDDFLPRLEAVTVAASQNEQARRAREDLGGFLLPTLFMYGLFAVALAWPLVRLVSAQNVGAERLLKRLQAYKVGLDEHSLVVAADAQGRITYANKKMCEVSGYSEDELIGQSYRILMSNVQPQAFFADLERTIKGGQIWRGEICKRSKDGGLYWVDTIVAPNDQDGPGSYISIHHDITERKRAEARAERHLFIQAIVADMQTELLTTGSLYHSFKAAFDVLLPNMSADVALLCEIEAAAGAPPSGAVMCYHRLGLDTHDRKQSPTFSDFDLLPASIQTCIEHGDLFGGLDARHLGASSFVGFPIQSGGRVIGLLAIGGDNVRRADAAEQLEAVVSTLAELLVLHRQTEERRNAEQNARLLARRDPLTGLGNRRFLAEEFDARCDHPDGRFGLLLIDLDRFKPINDTHGHQVGDQVLQIVAERLRNLVRGDCAVARLGGDEFAILTEPDSDTSGLGIMAQRVVEKISAPITIGAATLSVGASVGVAVYPDDSSSNDGLLSRADAAMYRAKERRGEAQFFDSSLDQAIKLKAELETEIRAAVQDGQIVPYFQPVVRLTNGELIGHEVLARWSHSVRGDIPPSQFIPIAEEAGAIDAIFWRLLREACGRHLKKRCKTILSVNLSPAQVRDPLLAQRILQALTEIGYPPSLLEIEITESTMLGDIDRVAPLFLSLKNQGVKLALDDFGTGYSSLLLLRDLPIDKLKIDKSFVSDMNVNDPASTVIVDSILNMAKPMGLVVTAEGIERADTALYLRRVGCDFGQGYLFGPPQSVIETGARPLEAAFDADAGRAKVTRAG